MRSEKATARFINAGFKTAAAFCRRYKKTNIGG
jgi:hypothetical protein